MKKLSSDKRARHVRLIAAHLVRHCVLYYGDDKPLNYATDVLRELSRALRRFSSDEEMTIEEMGSVAAGLTELPKPKKKKRKT